MKLSWGKGQSGLARAQRRAMGQWTITTLMPHNEQPRNVCGKTSQHSLARESAWASWPGVNGPCWAQMYGSADVQQACSSICGPVGGDLGWPWLGWLHSVPQVKTHEVSQGLVFELTHCPFLLLPLAKAIHKNKLKGQGNILGPLSGETKIHMTKDMDIWRVETYNWRANLSEWGGLGLGTVR